VRAAELFGSAIGKRSILNGNHRTPVDRDYSSNPSVGCHKNEQTSLIFFDVVGVSCMNLIFNYSWAVPRGEHFCHLRWKMSRRLRWKTYRRLRWKTYRRLRLCRHLTP